MVSTTTLDFVLDAPWCRALTSEQAARVRLDLRERHVNKGGSICHVGAQVQYWKGVVAGLVKMSVVSSGGRMSTFTGLAPGAWFGEGPVLRSDTWDFDGVAMRDTHIAMLPRTTFQWLLDGSLPFNRYIVTQLSERLAQCFSVIEAERLEVAETRVARCLAWLFNPVLYPGVGSRIELSQQEIGYLAGVSRQRVNRALRIMEEAGLLDVSYGAVVVRDLAGLQHFRA